MTLFENEYVTLQTIEIRMFDSVEAAKSWLKE